VSKNEVDGRIMVAFMGGFLVFVGLASMLIQLLL
jgi:hypothetical protein